MSNKKLPKAIKPEEFKLLLKNVPIKDKTAKVAFILAYESGLRISEVVALKKENIQEKSLEIWDAKGGRDRVVPKPKVWKDDMMKYIPINKSMRSLERNFKSASAKAKLPEFYTFHSLRHGFATRMIESGVPLSHVQALLGHSNISTTNVYTRARPVDALKSYEDMW